MGTLVGAVQNIRRIKQARDKLYHEVDELEAQVQAQLTAVLWSFHAKWKDARRG